MQSLRSQVSVITLTGVRIFCTITNPKKIVCARTKLTQRSAVVMIRKTKVGNIHFLANACNDFEKCNLLKVTQVEDDLGQTLHRDHTSLHLTSRGYNYQLTL